jgi:hypothetical protein
MLMPIVISISVITEASSNSYYLETGKTMKHAPCCRAKRQWSMFDALADN